MCSAFVKNGIYKLCVYKSYIICIKRILALNNIQWLICHET